MQLEAVVEESRTYGVRGEEGSLPGWGWEQKETDNEEECSYFLREAPG